MNEIIYLIANDNNDNTNSKTDLQFIAEQNN